MLLPRVFGEDLLDDFFGWDDFPFFDDKYSRNMEKKLYGRRAKNLMKTDIRETEEGYELTIDLPGFKREDVKASLENGYLTISAQKGFDQEETEKKTGRYIRRERYAGACQRSFYVGDGVTEDEIKGEFKHGILRLTIPKKEARPAVEEKKYIAIEG
ncbi:MAG TPA: Hsp20/alpha crystallin family protein [Candidatus Eisenbergiella merdigallinarum]|uniref:Hsp20/alpha crystallin family protein n=1 Tax=Candidatus Eisenbergiella merdigallinarum TaxID=2838552 RepID=A0A9D2SCD3_9FIRM|nr:Hsp20/alpha crystallin family protein [Candidatus Eisenbergiella merdigallinarum]